MICTAPQSKWNRGINCGIKRTGGAAGQVGRVTGNSQSLNYGIWMWSALSLSNTKRQQSYRNKTINMATVQSNASDGSYLGSCRYCKLTHIRTHISSLQAARHASFHLWRNFYYTTQTEICHNCYHAQQHEMTDTLDHCTYLILILMCHSWMHTTIKSHRWCVLLNNA